MFNENPFEQQAPMGLPHALGAPGNKRNPFAQFQVTALPRHLDEAGVPFAIASGSARLASVLPMMGAAAVGAVAGNATCPFDRAPLADGECGCRAGFKPVAPVLIKGSLGSGCTQTTKKQKLAADQEERAKEQQDTKAAREKAAAAAIALRPTPTMHRWTEGEGGEPIREAAAGVEARLQRGDGQRRTKVDREDWRCRDRPGLAVLGGQLGQLRRYNAASRLSASRHPALSQASLLT